MTEELLLTNPPSEQEVVYSPEMNDADLAKLLNKIGDKIGDVIASNPSVGGQRPPAIEARPKDHISLSAIGLLIAAAAAIGGLLALFVTLSLSSALSPIRESLAKLAEQSAGLRKDVDRVLDKESRAILSDPSIAGTQPNEVAEAAKRAVERSIPIQPKEIHLLSEELLKNITPAKWSAVNQLANLRSITTTTPEEAAKHIVQYVQPGDRVDALKPGTWAKVDGGTFVLDGTKGEIGALSDLQGNVLTSLSRMIFSGSHIIYRGGPMTLVDVFFENCTYDITNTPTGVEFAKQITGLSDSTNFVAN